MALIQLLNCPCGFLPNYLALLAMPLNCFPHRTTVLTGPRQQLLTKCVISSPANLKSWAALCGLFTMLLIWSWWVSACCARPWVCSFPCGKHSQLFKLKEQQSVCIFKREQWECICFLIAAPSPAVQLAHCATCLRFPKYQRSVGSTPCGQHLAPMCSV